MRHSVPERTINRISSTIKSLKRKRPLEGKDTGKNLSLDMLYKNGTTGLNNRLFKNPPSRFISSDKKRGRYLADTKVYNQVTQELLEEYYLDYL
jgi:hypothetical protein